MVVAATARAVKHLPWILAVVIAGTTFGGWADVPGLVAPASFAPTSYGCVAVMQPGSALLVFVVMAVMLGSAIFGLARGGPHRAFLAAFFGSGALIAIAIAANADAEARIARASIEALDANLSAGATEQDVLRAIAEANRAIAANDEDYRAALGVALTSSVTLASFDAPSAYGCVFRPREPGHFSRRFDAGNGSTMYEVRYALEGERAARVDHHRYIDAARGAHNRVVTSLID